MAYGEFEGKQAAVGTITDREIGASAVGSTELAAGAVAGVHMSNDGKTTTLEHRNLGAWVQIANFTTGSSATSDDVTTVVEAAAGITNERNNFTTGEGICSTGTISGDNTATAFQNYKVQIQTNADGEPIDDGTGGEVYGVLSKTGSVWTLNYYKESGAPHTLNAVAINFLFSEIFNLMRLPGDALLLYPSYLDASAAGTPPVFYLAIGPSPDADYADFDDALAAVIADSTKYPAGSHIVFTFSEASGGSYTFNQPITLDRSLILSLCGESRLSLQVLNTASGYIAVPAGVSLTINLYGIGLACGDTTDFIQVDGVGAECRVRAFDFLPDQNVLLVYDDGDVIAQGNNFNIVDFTVYSGIPITQVAGLGYGISGGTGASTQVQIYALRGLGNNTIVMPVGVNVTYVNGHPATDNARPTVAGLGGIASTDDFSGLYAPLRSSPPTPGWNGRFYYNTTLNKFRAYENGAWVDMIGGGAPVWNVDVTHVVHVSNEGTDAATAGSPYAPCKTLSYAVASLKASGTKHTKFVLHGRITETATVNMGAHADWTVEGDSMSDGELYCVDAATTLLFRPTASKSNVALMNLRVTNANVSDTATALEWGPNGSGATIDNVVWHGVWATSSGCSQGIIRIRSNSTGVWGKHSIDGVYISWSGTLPESPSIAIGLSLSNYLNASNTVTLHNLHMLTFGWTTAHSVGVRCVDSISGASNGYAVIDGYHCDGLTPIGTGDKYVSFGSSTDNARLVLKNVNAKINGGTDINGAMMGLHQSENFDCYVYISRVVRSVTYAAATVAISNTVGSSTGNVGEVWVEVGSSFTWSAPLCGVLFNNSQTKAGENTGILHLLTGAFSVTFTAGIVSGSNIGSVVIGASTNGTGDPGIINAQLIFEDGEFGATMRDISPIRIVDTSVVLRNFHAIIFMGEFGSPTISGCAGLGILKTDSSDDQIILGSGEFVFSQFSSFADNYGTTTMYAIDTWGVGSGVITVSIPYDSVGYVKFANTTNGVTVDRLSCNTL